jgi:hypothetical protein
MYYSALSAQKHALLVALSHHRTSCINLQTLTRQIEGLKWLIQHIDIPQTHFPLATASDNLLLIADIINSINRISMTSTLQSAF